VNDRQFAQRLREHAGAVTAYARAVAADRWAADDAVQEAFLRAWQYRDSFRASGSFEGWLIRICRNCVIDLTAKCDQPADEPPDIGGPCDELPELFDLLSRLPIHQREVVAICALLGYDYASAADLLNVPVGTVRSRLHRAREAIAAQLDDALEIEPA
jgi:RNA polymerase sigma-70 factor, ECF subfamily